MHDELYRSVPSACVLFFGDWQSAQWYFLAGPEYGTTTGLWILSSWPWHADPAICAQFCSKSAGQGRSGFINGKYHRLEAGPIWSYEYNRQAMGTYVPYTPFYSGLLRYNKWTFYRRQPLRRYTAVAPCSCNVSYRLFVLYVGLCADRSSDFCFTGYYQSLWAVGSWIFRFAAKLALHEDPLFTGDPG